MTKITVSMIFESKTPLTDKQRAILRNLVDDYQCAIGESVGMDEIEWSIESEPVPSHKNYLYEDNDSADCEIIGAGGEVWTGSMPSWD